jgi:hypothetical protein
MDLQEPEVRTNDELSNLVAMAMVSAVGAMALIVMVTVLAFRSGVTIA